MSSRRNDNNRALQLAGVVGVILHGRLGLCNILLGTGRTCRGQVFRGICHSHGDVSLILGLNNLLGLFCDLVRHLLLSNFSLLDIALLDFRSLLSNLLLYFLDFRFRSSGLNRT